MEFFSDRIQKIGFIENWVRLIMDYVTTPQFSFMINGELCGFMKHYRRLREGCPLLPYLFIIYAQAFSCLLRLNL